MNYGEIKTADIANGTGVRVSLFVSGCRRHCKDCFNSETWDFCYGNEFTDDTMNEIITAMDKEYIKGFSLLGGEPFEKENRICLASLLEKIRAEYPAKSVWCYSGYDFENDILKMSEDDEKDKTFAAGRMLSCIDFIVDGRFIETQKSPALRFKGSANQRIIDVRASLERGETIRWKHDCV